MYCIGFVLHCILHCTLYPTLHTALLTILNTTLPNVLPIALNAALHTPLNTALHTTAEGREYLGPKLRPVCGAVESSNDPLSHMLSEILDHLGDGMDVEIGAMCLSTEEMCGALEVYNTRASTTSCLVIFSMDMVAMFPNLQHEGVARTCREEFLRSDLIIKEVDTEALGIHLAILYQDRMKEL